MSAVTIRECPRMHGLSRRQVLYGAAPLAISLAEVARAPLSYAQGTMLEAKAPRTFDFAALIQIAKVLAGKAYVAARAPVPDVVARIDFDAAQKITFRAEKALWNDGPGPFPVRFFHVDKFNPLPVRINALSGGVARPLAYSPDYFSYGDPELAAKLPADLGFSGFRVMDGTQASTDWLAFQGASYFRSAGQANQYGGSARGIAVNTAASTKEEFPRFVEFWLEEPDRHGSSITIYALLDGPSLTGAYHFVASKQTGVITDVRAELFIRSNVAQLGIAPLTSMYWFGENERQHATDWRPEIHDSDGLSMWTGTGERIWRPLINPPSVRTNSFLDENPKAFGLMQRDRIFADYQDDGAFYNRRPSMWVEPQGQWDAGAVQLVEIPTQDEIHDNIVTYWTPKRAVKAGDQLRFAYRLYWQDDEPSPPSEVARVIATRIGRGGIPGQPSPEDKDSWKFVVDFTGGALSQMPARFDITPVVSTSRGKIGKAYVIKVVGTDQWRALFDVHAPGKEQIGLRCYLRLGENALTETWLYQYFPPV
jgi:periplasmic glucans biosynthesis protein